MREIIAGYIREIRPNSQQQLLNSRTKEMPSEKLTRKTTISKFGTSEVEKLVIQVQLTLEIHPNVANYQK